MNDAPGREARFRQLVTQDAYAAVWRYCYRLTGNREDAEDLGQESLARAFERIGDRCCNISEYIIYLVKGKDVRHISLDQIKKEFGS